MNRMELRSGKYNTHWPLKSDIITMLIFFQDAENMVYVLILKLM